MLSQALILLSKCLWALLWMTCGMVTSEKLVPLSQTVQFEMDTVEFKHDRDYLPLFVSIWRTGSQSVQLDFYSDSDRLLLIKYTCRNNVNNVIAYEKGMCVSCSVDFQVIHRGKCTCSTKQLVFPVGEPFWNS